MNELRRVLNVRDIVLLNVVAIVGLRWILTAAQSGPSALVLWLLAFLLFFLPISFAVVELTTRYPQEGGIYQWTKRAFGPFHGFMAGWTYWVNNLIYYPSLLMFVAGNAIYIAGSRYTYLGENPYYVVLFSIGALWIALFFNIIGLRIGRWVHNAGAVGTWGVAALLIGLALYLGIKEGSANTFQGQLLPDFGEFKTVAFFATICFAFAGVELSALLNEEIKEPGRTIPRAIFISGIVITLIYVLGTLSLLIALPDNEIGIISGITDALGELGDRLGIGFLLAVAALGITLGGIGGVGTWLSGTARIPFVIGIDRYLPAAFGRIHPRWKTPHVALLWQGILSTVFILAGVVGSGIQEAYLFLLDTTIIIYFIPYLYLFLALSTLRDSDEKAGDIIRVPFGKPGFVFTIIAGLFTTGLSIILSFIPPEGSRSPLLFVVKVFSGTALFLIVGVFIYYRQRIPGFFKRPGKS